MGFAEEMTNLGENIMGALDARINFLGQNIVDVKNSKLDTKKMINKFHKDHQSMGRKLKADLGTFVDDLTGTVDTLRHKFQKEQKAAHHECQAAHNSWEKTSKTMASKRRNIKTAVKNAQQRAQKSH